MKILKILKKNCAGLLTLAALLAAMLPWFIVQMNMSVNTDIAYLTLSALRMLGGEAMSAGYYDTNPPLSILVQIPPALLVKYLSVPVYTAVFAYGLVIVALSAWAVNAILKAAHWVGTAERHTLLMAYILFNTIGAGLYLGERDHLVGLALFPFVLLQAALTYKIVLDKRLTGGVIGAASILLLLKPHYGLVPLVMFAHRSIVQKRLSVFKDPDFIGLCAGVVVYLLLTGLFFRDFITVILPDVITLYVTETEKWALKLAVSFGATTLAFAGAAWLLFEKPQKFIAALFALSALCIIPYALQGKGFYYHSLPAAIFGVSAFALLSHRLFYAGALKTKFAASAGKLGNLSAVFVIIALLYTVLPPNRAYPTHEDYRNAQLAQIIKSCDRPDCSFFLFNDMIEMTQQLAVYTGQKHASRFPAFWFLPGLLKADIAHKHWHGHSLSRDEINAIAGKYAHKVVEDFQKYEPDTLIIGFFHIIPESPAPFDFVDFFSDHSAIFREIMNGYEHADTIYIDRSTYFGGTLFEKDSVRYDVYKKKDIHDKKG